MELTINRLSHGITNYINDDLISYINSAIEHANYY